MPAVRSKDLALVAAACACLAAGCDWPWADERLPLQTDPEYVTLWAEEGSTTPVATTVTVTFEGPDIVLWTATCDQTWLSVEPASGATGYGGEVTVCVVVDPTGVKAGFWRGHVYFEDVNGFWPGCELTVLLYVSPGEYGSGFGVSPDPARLHALAGDTDPVSVDVELSLAGGANVGWRATWPGAADWLDVSPDGVGVPQFLSDGESVTITLTADPDGRPAALYRTTVTFAAPGGEAAPLVLTVSFAVRPVSGSVGMVVEYVSSVDLSLQPYGIRLPSGYDAAWGARPVAVHLHAYSSTWEDGLDGFDTDAKGVADDAANRWILVNLAGRGNKFYDGTAETDLFEVLTDVDGAWGVDWTRVFLEGYSMGATGAFRHIARHPDVFAGCAGANGWTDHRQWHRHWYGPAAEPYEIHASRRANLEIASPVTHAENVMPGRLWIAVGGADSWVWPENGEKLHERLLRLDGGAGVAHTYVYDAGGSHSGMYDTAAIYAWLEALAPLDPDPEDVPIRVRSNRLRTARHSWLRVERFAWDGFAEVVAKRLPVAGLTCTFEIASRNVERFSITSAPDPGAGGNYVVKVDGVTCADVPRDSASFPLTIELDLDGAGGVDSGALYVAPQPTPLAKTPSLEGPVARALSERFIVAYGSSDPALVWKTYMDANELCRAWAGDFSGDCVVDTIGEYGFNAIIEPVDEKTVSRAQMAQANLVIFGSEETSVRIMQMCSDPALDFHLPVRLLEDAILMGGKCYPVPEHGIWIVYPNPLAPNRLVVVGHNVVGSGVDGTWGEILWTQESWPWAWPDYVIFDTSEPLTRLDRQGELYAADQFVAAGSFDRDWRLPKLASHRTRVEITEPVDGASYASGTPNAFVTVFVEDVTDLGSVPLSGLGELSFEFRLDGELRAATFDGVSGPGSYDWTLPFADVPHLPSTDPDPDTTYDLTVEVVRPHPDDGHPIAGLGLVRIEVE